MGDVKAGGPDRSKILSAPIPLSSNHDLKLFSCGNQRLDDWLQGLALISEGKSARTFVVCDGERVVGYYSLANGSVLKTDMPKKLRFSMPDPVPVIIIGRLARDRDYAGCGIGPGLMKDAFRRIAHVSETSGFRAILVHAIDDNAVGFYLKYDFRPFPPASTTMFLSITTLRDSLGL